MSLKYFLSRPFLPIAAYFSALYFRHGNPSRERAEWLLSLLNRYINHHGFSFVAKTAFRRTLQVNTRDFLQNKIFYFGLWEPRLTRYILSRNHSDGIFLDIGANIGYFSIAAASRFKRVIAVEASPEIAALLQHNIDRNGLANITVENVAAGDKNGEIFVNLAPDHNIGQTAISKDEKSGSRKIRMTTIDNLLSPNELSNIRLIKIDVEGAEFSVLQNILTIAHAMHPHLEIVAEITPAKGLEECKKQKEIWTAILESGFTPFVLQEEYDLSDYLEDRFVETEMKTIKTIPNKQTDLLFRRN